VHIDGLSSLHPARADRTRMARATADALLALLMSIGSIARVGPLAAAALVRTTRVRTALNPQQRSQALAPTQALRLGGSPAQVVRGGAVKAGLFRWHESFNRANSQGETR